ncbi:MAG: HAMP domain-containing protein [Oscillatoria sp. SIO1A7]|nr:HAMP domain-containing protein [Oscillatoria sp. SIO1A7]
MVTDSPNPIRNWKLPLRLVLVVPFVVQICGAVGLTGWLSLQNGQKAVNDLAARLRQEISARIEQQLRNYLEAPRAINRVNANAIALGQLDLKDAASLTGQFWLQRDLFKPILVSAIYFGGADGEFIGLGFQNDNTWQIGRAGSSTKGKFYSYAADDRGFPSKLLETGGDYDPRTRPWYQYAVAAGETTWSDIYVDFKDPRLKITLVRSVYSDAGKLQGVLGVDFVLSHIRAFLQSLEIGESGETFIMDRSGLLVASSTSQQPFAIDGKKVERLEAAQVTHPLIKESAAYLAQHFGSYGQIEASVQLDFKINREKKFLHVLPFRDGENLDWLIVVVVSEQDFMKQIQANTRTTVILCFAALVVAIVVGGITARSIVEPILKLSKASKAIATGDFLVEVPVERQDELGTLARAFQEMREDIRISHQQLEDYSRFLEIKVSDRTEKLQKEVSDRQLLEERLRGSEQRMRAVFEAMNNIILVVDREVNIDVLPTNAALLYESENDIISCTIEHFFEEGTGEIWQDRVIQALEIKKTISFDYSLDLGEDEVWFSARISPMTENTAIWVARDISDRKEAEIAARVAQEQSERLLLNVLPQAIAQRLKQDTQAIADYFEEAAILFSDIVGFTPLSARMEPIELVSLLNQMFSTFDELTEKHGLEKIKTIGDAYMVAGGLPVPRPECLEAVADMALDMQAAIDDFRVTLPLPGGELGERFQIRIGIHLGPVVAGVIGRKRFIYDLWGDTVNVASRMESSGLPGKIQVTVEVYNRLKDRYRFQERGAIAVKGKGEMIAYWLLGKN